MAITLEFDALCEEAHRVTGIDRFASSHFAPGLKVLLESAGAEADLTPRGRSILRSEMLRILSQRLLAGTSVEPSPSLKHREVLIVTGLPRTGSTLLHNLLALDPDSATVPLWRALFPFPSAPSPAQVQARIKATRLHLKLADRYEPALRRIHPMEATRPDECGRLLQLTGESELFAATFRVPRYSAWLDGQPVKPRYHFLRGLLDAIFPGGERVVLKDPCHLPHLRVITEVWPNARFVWLHRDPSQAIASFCSLVATARSVHSGVTDRGALGEELAPRLLSRLRAAREDREGLPIKDVDYEALCLDPVATLEEVYRDLGWTLQPGTRAAWKNGLADFPRMPHEYAGGDFGLDRVFARLSGEGQDSRPRRR